MKNPIKALFSKMDMWSLAPGSTQNCEEVKQKIYVIGSSLAVPMLTAGLTWVSKCALERLGKAFEFICSGLMEDKNVCILSQTDQRETGWKVDMVLVISLMISVGAVTSILVRWASTIPPRPKEELMLKGVEFPFTKLNPLLTGKSVARIAIEDSALNVLNFTRAAKIKIECSDKKERVFPNVVAATLAQAFSQRPDLIEKFTGCSDWRAALALAGENQRNADDGWGLNYLLCDGSSIKQAHLKRCDYWLFSVLSAYFQQHAYALKSLQQVPMSLQIEHFLIQETSLNTFSCLNEIILNIRTQLNSDVKL